jgi:hypothetical protein
MRTCTVAAAAAAFAMIALGPGVPAAVAALQAELSGSAIEPTPGVFEYTYILTNAADSSVPVLSVQIDMPGNALPFDLRSPDGWTWSLTSGSGEDGQAFLQFESADAAFDVLPGDTASFGFRSQLAPDLDTYVVAGLDESSEFAFASGIVITPGVPEPTALLTLAAAMMALAVRRR